MNPLLLVDSYKLGHVHQYPPKTGMVYSNFTPRTTRTGYNKVMFYGLQYFIKQYLIEDFNKYFFHRDLHHVLTEYKNTVKTFYDNNIVHIEELWRYGQLPLEIKALPEGSLVPIRVPMLTIRNTDPDFYWLTNTLETLMSSVLWMPCTSATTSFRYRQNFEKYANETCDNKDMVKFQGHDFSFRGMSSVESAIVSGSAHLLSFLGSDTVPATTFLQKYYNGSGFIGCSVPATEHSVQSVAIIGNLDVEYVEEEYDETTNQWIPIKFYKSNPSNDPNFDNSIMVVD